MKIRIIVKDGNKRLPGLYLRPEVEDYIAFCLEYGDLNECTLIFQTGESDTAYRYYGRAHYFSDKIYIWTCTQNVECILDTIGHEIGHLWHYHNDKQSHFYAKCIKESLANDFALDVMNLYGIDLVNLSSIWLTGV